MVFLRRICSSRPGDGEQRGQSLAALTARGRGLDCFQPQPRQPVLRRNKLRIFRSVCFSFPHEVGYFVGTPFIARRCVSKQIGRHDAACQGCPRCVSRSPEARCLRVVARAMRFSQPAGPCGVVRVAGYSVVWDYDPPISPKEHQKERCGHSRSQRSFITFYSALRNILLSAGFPTAVP